MVYRWRPRPSWLKQVHFNAAPVPSDKKPPQLKVYWGHFTTLSWQDLLDAAELSRDEPQLLYVSQVQKQKLQESRYNFKSMTWLELLGKSVIHRPLKISATVSWKDLVREPAIRSLDNGKEDIGLGTVHWDDLLVEAEND